MAYHPRIESEEYGSFITTRSRNSELWFVNNEELEASILGYTAKYRKCYEAKLYALAIEGNHIQCAALFPKCNRANFMRDLNSAVARAVPRHTPEYNGGRFWARRYSSELLPAPEDIEERFFYTVLQPVQDGLVSRVSDYPGYNCFEDAIWGRKRRFKIVWWGKYNAARRTNPNVPIEKFTEIVELEYDRLPGYEGLEQREYAQLMRSKLHARQNAIVKARRDKGLGFAGKQRLLAVKRGSLPKSTKVSAGPKDHRPRVLAVCPKRRSEMLNWYFQMYFAYKAASKRYRAGELDVCFPKGMYPPNRPAVGILSG